MLDLSSGGNRPIEARGFEMIRRLPPHSAKRFLVTALILGTSVQAVFADATWRVDELERMASADDFHLVPYRDDHVTLGKPTRLLPVTVDGELYVRAQDGTRSSWYQAAVGERGGQIIAAGMTRMVAFERAQGDINEKIDAAYRARYAANPKLKAMISPRANATTVRIRPLGTSAK